MLKEPLVVSDEALTNAKILRRDFHYVKVADRTFDLGLDHTRFRQEEEISNTASVLQYEPYMATTDLLYMAIAKKLSKEEKREIDESGMTDERRDVAIWRTFHEPEIAALLDEYYSLSDDVDIQIIREEGGGWPEIANLTEIEERMEEIRARLKPLSAEAIYSIDEMTSAVCQRFNLDLRPLEAFNQYWIAQIMQAPGFLTFDPKDDDDSWSLANEPYGWLTKRHGAALKKHGYTYRFGFWEQNIGYARGHLWIQTDRGPLRLTDSTDAVSLRSIFPVQVSTIAGEPLFELVESDVPGHLMRDGPDIPPELSGRRSN